MKLPFLKNKRLPRVATTLPDEKLVNGSSADHLEDHAIEEFMTSVKEKDVKGLRDALEALVLNMFQSGDSENETNDG